MRLEIERRFLIDGRNDKPWRGGKTISMIQHYLSNVIYDSNCIEWNGVILVENVQLDVQINTWRVRQENEKYRLTAKGKRIGAVAHELEWDLSDEIYNSLELEGLPSTQKTRHLWNGEDNLEWEIDEFEGALAGLIIAEIELDDESQEIVIPQWVGLELTNLKDWSNASLARMVMDALGSRCG